MRKLCVSVCVCDCVCECVHVYDAYVENDDAKACCASSSSSSSSGDNHTDSCLAIVWLGSQSVCVCVRVLSSPSSQKQQHRTVMKIPISHIISSDVCARIPNATEWRRMCRTYNKPRHTHSARTHSPAHKRQRK